MRKYIFGMAALALAALFGIANHSDGQGKAAQKSDKDKLQGTWSVVSIETAGKPVPDEFIKKAEMKLVFAGDKATMKMAMGDEDQSTFTLDPTKSPKTIDVTSAKGKKMKGIYTFDGDDKLTVAMSKDNDERPTGFKTKEDSTFGVLVLKREKAK